MLPPLSSLVKYDNPVLVSTSRDKGGKSKGATGKKVIDIEPVWCVHLEPPHFFTRCRLAATQGSLPPVEQKPGLTQTEDILNSILPPREWTEEGQLWVQYVSSTPATRLDVINLQEKLDQQLQQRQVRSAEPSRVQFASFACELRPVGCGCRHVRRAFARCGRSCMHSALMKSSGKLPSTVLSGGCCSYGSEMRCG